MMTVWHKVTCMICLSLKLVRLCKETPTLTAIVSLHRFTSLMDIFNHTDISTMLRIKCTLRCPQKRLHITYLFDYFMFETWCYRSVAGYRNHGGKSILSQILGISLLDSFTALRKSSVDFSADVFFALNSSGNSKWWPTAYNISGVCNNRNNMSKLCLLKIKGS